MNDEIGRRLREAAQEHQPDRARMLARVQRGTAGTTHGVVGARTAGIGRSWPRVAFAGLAAAGIVAVAGIAVAAILPETPPKPDTAITLSSPHPTSSTTEPAPPAQPTQPNRTTTARATPDAPPPLGDSAGPLTSRGTIDPHSHAFWTQNTLTLTTTQPLTALTVELRVKQTGGVESTGQWQTGPTDDFTIAVEELDGTVLYRWTLKPGHAVPAADHAFAAQYNHTANRTPQADTYTVHATTADGTFTVQGTFKG
ncbi:hypothetical protein [Saccharothrix variisporea]|uniref:Uncharacterized protein n=1 Tax=Saccharothrix variisporea TaxID=543527 RepID=A0A495XF40_9PSEU|nr:hypothetical protein [Saccharothrix variisporea]RKT72642.1 hypothetical protein DFJ66_5963 [Saccharothrix variisporea]